MDRWTAIGGVDETLAHIPALGRSTETHVHVQDVAQVDATSRNDDLVGTILGGYSIESFLGRGSMATVYRARHLGLERVSALKVMDRARIARQPGIRERFWAEARAAANLVHPHVVTIHNLGDDRGHHFIEMEYVPGGLSLKEALVHQGPFEVQRAVRLVRQVVLALGAAHRSGVVHRDIKPANVLLTQQGDAKLADFGLVHRLVDGVMLGSSVAGTPTFMAPELFRGAPASPRSDFYAVGVMLFYLLTGRLPFASEQLSKLIQLHQVAPIPDVRDIDSSVPESVVEILDRCLRKSPVERFGTAEELAVALERTMSRMRDTEGLVRESVKDLDCLIQGGRDSFRLLIPQPGDRLQEVLIEVTEGQNDESCLCVFSVCGPAEAKHYAFALRTNARLCHGSLSIRDVLGTPMFVMSRTFARERVGVAELRDAVIEIAEHSDQIEHRLTSLDLF